MEYNDKVYPRQENGGILFSALRILSAKAFRPYDPLIIYRGFIVTNVLLHNDRKIKPYWPMLRLKALVNFISTRYRKIPSLVLLSVRRQLYKSGFHSFRAGFNTPAVIMIRMTNRCNMRCFFCGQHGEKGAFEHQGPGEVAKELSTAQWISLVQQVQEFKPYMHFTGGEPLLRDDTADLIRYCTSRNLLTHLNTNGIKLEENAGRLVEAGLDFISCSLDTNGVLSADITGNKNAFDWISAGVSALMQARHRLKSRFPMLQLFCTVNKLNQHYLVEIAEIAERLQADVFTVSLPIFTTPELAHKTSKMFQRHFGIQATSWDGFIADMAMIDPVVVAAQIGKIQSRRWRFSFRQVPPECKGFDYRTYFRDPGSPLSDACCRLPFYLAVVSPNGDVSTCWDHPDYVVGNILQTRFPDIWQGERYEKFRTVIKEKMFPACGRCTGLYFKG